LLLQPPQWRCPGASLRRRHLAQSIVGWDGARDEGLAAEEGPPTQPVPDRRLRNTFGHTGGEAPRRLSRFGTELTDYTIGLQPCRQP
jgi:hypothetical protein